MKNFFMLFVIISSLSFYGMAGADQNNYGTVIGGGVQQRGSERANTKTNKPGDTYIPPSSESNRQTPLSPYQECIRSGACKNRGGCCGSNCCS